MPRNTHIHPSDLHGFSRLVIDAVVGITGLVEAMHHTILRVPGILGKPSNGPTRGITGLVYRIIHLVTAITGGGIDAVLAQLVPMLGGKSTSPERETILAVLNGVLGDYLAATGNPLAIPMRFRREGIPLEIKKNALAAAIPRLNGRLLVLPHGLCMNDLQWTRQGHNHGEALARDLGYTPVWLHYNGGLHISTNGQAFSGLMDSLVAEWPVPLEELVIVAHSMGGLVTRSAFHYGTIEGHRWMRHLKKLVFISTPHHGAPLERGGNWVDIILGVSPYTAPFARIGKIRSAGITDLRHGSLLDEDWEGLDRFAHPGDLRLPLPLPDGVVCYAIATTIGKQEGDLNDLLRGDGIIPLDSALGRHRDPAMALPFPESRRWIGYGMNHLDMLSRPEVYEQIRRWLAS